MHLIPRPYPQQVKALLIQPSVPRDACPACYLVHLIPRCPATLAMLLALVVWSRFPALRAGGGVWAAGIGDPQMVELHVVKYR